MTRTLLIVAFMTTMASAFLLTAAHAQNKKQPAAGASGDDSFFSSDSKLVLVDSVVTDKKGGYIADLIQKDFKVREDGKEQAINSFSYLADGAADDQKQYVVLFFDHSTVPQIDQSYARAAALKFIGANAGRNRLMALVEFDGTLRVTQNLTDDTERLKQAVNGAKSSVLLANTRSMGMRSINNTASGLPEALRNLAEGLAKVPGRKTIVLFSEGRSLSQDLMKGAIEECNRSNAAIYPVDVRALAGGPSDRGASPGCAQMAGARIAMPCLASDTDLSAQSSPDALYGLAQATGGFVASSPAKLADDLDRIGKEESQYYILSYLPANQSQPGACHKIKVAVDRSGANVRARTSYCDTVIPEVVIGTAPERDLEARLNANATPTVQATMQAPFFYVAPNTARVDLALDIPGAGLKFVRDKGKFTATLNVLGIAYLPDNGVAARFNDTRKVTLDDQQQVDEFASRPYHFEKQFEMASGTFDLKVAFSSAAASFGKVETELTIEPWEPSKFLVSGLALSQATHPASAAGLDDVDLFGDQVPLVANGVQFIPAGTNRLQRPGKAYVYGEIYAPAPGVSAQLSVLNLKTGETVKQAGITNLKPDTASGNSAVPFGLILPTDDLAPGLYTVQIAAQDGAGNHFVRRINFEFEH